jgi:hypothetical protein
MIRNRAIENDRQIQKAKHYIEIEEDNHLHQTNNVGGLKKIEIENPN